MAARTIGMDELGTAVKEYAARHELTVSSNEKGYCLMPGDVVIALQDGKPSCSNAEILDNLIEILMDLAENAPKSSNLAVRGNGRITSRSQAGSAPGSALEAVRECQGTEKTTYSTGGGRKAASAKTNIAALMEAGGSLEIKGRIHEKDYIEVVVGAILGERHVESSISIYKQEYLAKKAWDWIVKVLMDEPGIVIGTDEYGMPEFREGATIKVRISDEGKSVLVPLPAKIALWRELAREWQFAGRVCESKAYSRAADMLLRGDWQSPEEKAEELAEVQAVQEAKA
ncbi:MAG: hypothetical protein EOM68_28130 [Spirochaetia bacterium]|nr:hypothetical protein [Spirochaetia bacterium]